MVLPYLRGQNSKEEAVEGHRGEAGSAEGGGVVGKLRDAKTGEQAEGEVEEADQSLCRAAEQARGNAEVGEKPKRSRGEMGSRSGDEPIEFGLGEAIEEEVGDDEVVGVRGLEGAGIDLVGLEAGECTARSTPEKVEHGGAEVDGVGLEMAVAGQEGCEKAAVSVAEDESLAGCEEAWKKVKAAAVKGSAEGEVFEPAVWAGD